jgi:WD40 repeat protein
VARGSGIPSATLGGYFSGRHLPSLTQLPVLDATLTALGVTDEHEIQGWHRALRRIRKAAVRPRTAEAPYRGLKAFSEEDAGLFFGREAIVEQLMLRVSQMSARPAGGILVLVGPSGSGKSSVLRAGLVPGLRRNHVVDVLVPGTDPLAGLARATAEHQPDVLIVDQAEEVFSPEVDSRVRRAFLTRLDDMASAKTVVVLALRADFYGQAANEPLLVRALRDDQVLLGAMSLDDLRAAILNPAQAVGVSVDGGLLDLLLRDLTGQRPAEFAYDAGALPLLSHALLSTWGHHQGPSLTASDYLAVGGLHGAVKQSAEDVYLSFDDAGKAAAQWLFGQLVLVDPDGAMTRRRLAHDTLRHPDPVIDAALDGVIEAYVSGRLLTAQESSIEISHEALLSAWPRLYEWVLSDLDAARLQSRIAESAQVWRDRSQDPDLLLRGGPLLDAKNLIDDEVSPRALTPEEREFVQASDAAEKADVERERRRVTRLRTIVAATTVFAVLATFLAGVAYWSRTEATTQRSAAEQARDDALSSQLGIAADTVRPRDPAAAAQLALAGYTIAPTLTARSALLDSTGVATPMRFVGPEGEMHAVATADGALLAVSGRDGVTRLWQRDAQGQYHVLPDLPPVGEEQPGPIWASAFSPDGQTLVIADVDDPRSTVQFWDLTNPATPVALGTRQVAGSVRTMAFAPDGGEVLVGTSLAAIHGWALDGLKRVPARTGFTGQVMAVSFDPAGDRLAAGIDTGSVVVITGDDRRVVRVPGGSSVDAVAFSPDGAALASGQKAGVVRLWKVSPQGRLTADGEPFGGFQSWVNAVTFSDDGQLLAAANSDGHVRLFSTSDRTVVADLPTPSVATSVQFIDNDSGLVTSEVSGTAKLWPLPTPVLTGFNGAIWSLHVDDRNRTLMVGPATTDGALHLFALDELGQPSPMQVLRSDAAGPTDGSSGMSGDGTWVAGGTGDGHVAVWERRGDRYVPAGVGVAGTTIIQNVAISQDGTLMAAVDDEGLLSLWHLRSGEAPERFSQTPLGAPALAVAISPDARLVASGLTNSSIQLTTVDGTVVTPGAKLEGFRNSLNTVAFAPSGTYVAGGSDDQTVRLWDVSEPAAPTAVGEPLQGPGGAVYGLGWSEDGQRLAAGSKDGTAWLWDMTDPAAPVAVATLNSPGVDLLSVAFGQGGTLFAAGADNEVIRWNTDVQQVAARTCQLTGAGLDDREWSRLMPSMPFHAVC